MRTTYLSPGTVAVDLGSWVETIAGTQIRAPIATVEHVFHGDAEDVGTSVTTLKPLSAKDTP